MPLNDVKQQTPRLVRAGKIRLGYKAKKCPGCNKISRVNDIHNDRCPLCGASTAEANEFPTDSNHFVLTDAPELAEIYGHEPTRLNIWFPFNTVEENMPAFHKLRNGPFVTCQGDGARITYAVNPQTGRAIVRDGYALEDFSETDSNGKPAEFTRGEYVPCPGREHNLYAKCKFCAPSLSLKFLVREVPRMAYFEITSRSLHNYLMLDGQLSYFTAPHPDGLGMSLKYVPFYLLLKPQQISVPNLDRNGQPKKISGKPQPRIFIEKYLLSLEIDPEYLAKLYRVQNQLADPGRMLALPGGAPVDEPADYDDDEETLQPLDVAGPGTVIEMPAPAPAPAKPLNGNGHRAIFEPADLKATLEKMAGKPEFKDRQTGDALPARLHPLGEKVPNLVSALFQSAFEGDEADKQYHTCLAWLTGQDSATKLTAGWIDALLYWLMGKENKKALEGKQIELKDAFRLGLPEQVVEECRRVHRSALQQAGQADMFGESQVR